MMAILKNMYTLAKYQTKGMWWEVSNGDLKWGWRTLLIGIFVDGIWVGAKLFS